MHISHESRDVNAISHHGKRFEPDEFGRFDVPPELAEHLLTTPGWSLPDRKVIEIREAPAEDDGEPKEKPQPRKRSTRAKAE